MIRAQEMVKALEKINDRIRRQTPALPEKPWTKGQLLGMAFDEGDVVIIRETGEKGVVIGLSNRVLLMPPKYTMTDGGNPEELPESPQAPKEPWEGILKFTIPERRDVEIYLIKLPDGRIVAKTKEELERERKGG